VALLEHKDYRLTDIGRQNWEVCARMLVHDLLDEANENPALAKILSHYNISYTPDGGYTMALPRLKVLEVTCLRPKPKKLKKTHK